MTVLRSWDIIILLQLRSGMIASLVGNHRVNGMESNGWILFTSVEICVKVRSFKIASIS